MRRFIALLGLTIGLTFLVPGVAHANHVSAMTADCDGWSVSFENFHDTDADVVVTIDGTTVAIDHFEGDYVATGPLPEGAADDGEVVLGANWTHNGEPIEANSETFEVDCDEPTESPTPSETLTPPTDYPPSPNCHDTNTCHTRPPQPPPSDTAFTGPGDTVTYGGIVLIVLLLVGGAALLRSRSTE